MAKADSTRSASVAEQRKPHPDFPLTWNKAARYWVKKVRGTVHRFGPRDCDPDTALAEWLRVKDDLLAGRKPRDNVDGITVRYACNHFLTDRQHRIDAGELTQRSWNEYKATCELLVAEFGPNRMLDDLRPDDFMSLRSKWSKKWGPTTLGNQVQRTRVWLNYCWQAELCDKPIRTGPSFKRPSKKIIRQQRQAKGKRLFEPEQLHALIKAASIEMRAMILLAINCGLGNRDCAKLEGKHIAGEWLDYSRPKTAIERRAKLWPETLAALAEVQAKRKTPKDEQHAALIFVTKYGGPWYSPDGGRCPISAEFRKLLDDAFMYRPGLSFYALRHCFETIAGESKDQVAVDAIVGHARDDMASVYREKVSDDRLSAVAEHVRGWLFGEGARS
ncbi:MAG: hypothetical protein KDB23_22775 [Planctomycetales bacterium]|nr:hypothetical protein [Planctomycetales bacterium]